VGTRPSRAARKENGRPAVGWQVARYDKIRVSLARRSLGGLGQGLVSASTLARPAYGNANPLLIRDYKYILLKVNHSFFGPLFSPCLACWRM